MKNLIHPSQISWQLAWSDLFPLFQNLHTAICGRETLQKVIFTGNSIAICQNLQRIWQQLMEEYAYDNGCILETDLVPATHKVTTQLSYTNQISLTCPIQDPDELFLPCQYLTPLLQDIEAGILMVTRNFCLWLQVQTDAPSGDEIYPANGLAVWIGKDLEPELCTRWRVTVVLDHLTLTQIFQHSFWISHTPLLARAIAAPDRWQEQVNQVWGDFLQRTLPAPSVSAHHHAESYARSQVEVNLFQSVLQQMPIGMFRADLDGSILEANTAFCQLTGYTNAQLARLDLQALTDAQDFAKELDMIQHAVRYGEQRIYEKRYRRLDGQVIWAEVKLAFVGDYNHEEGFLLGFVTDLSDRDQIDAQRLQAIQDIQKHQAQEELLNTIATQIRSSIDLPSMLQSAVNALNQALDCDRVVIYQLAADGSGVCTSEAVKVPFSPMQGISFGSECIPPPYLEAYRTGRLWHAENLASAPLADCHRSMLAQVQVQSMVAVGILSMDESLQPNHRQLWGLLVVHQCRSPRPWLADELKLIQDVAHQLDIALEQTKLLNQLTQYTQELEERVNQRTQSLERSLQHEQLIRRLAEYLYQDFSHEKLFESIVQGLINHLSADICLVSLYNEETKRFEIKFEAFRSTVKTSLSCLEQSFSWHDLSSSLQSQIVQHQAYYSDTTLVSPTLIQPLHAICIQQQSPTPNALTGSGSEVMYPIISGDEPIGFLSVLQLSPRVFDAADMELIQQASNYGAIALRQARLYQQEHEQRLSAEYLRSFLEQSTDVYVEYDAQLRYTAINPVGCELLGYPLHAILGKTNQELLDVEQCPLAPLIQQAFDTAEKVFVDHEIALADGKRMFESVYAPITDPTGIVQRVIGVCRDVTDFKDQWQLLEKQNHQLAETTRIKQEFVAMTSHELRTPLTAILGFSNVLLQEFLGELNTKQKDYIERIHDSGQHLLELINDILDLSRLEAGRMELDLQTVFIGDICEAVVSFIQERATSQGLTLDIAIDTDVEWIIVDPRRLKQMLLNLLSNALKFTPQGTVGLRVYCNAQLISDATPHPDLIHPLLMNSLNVHGRMVQCIHFLVWDTGIGISEADQRSLFVPFSQIDSTLSHKHQGSGLGLVITQKLAELHGGWISLQSKQGQGSQFTLSLPLQ